MKMKVLQQEEFRLPRKKVYGFCIRTYWYSTPTRFYYIDFPNRDILLCEVSQAATNQSTLLLLTGWNSIVRAYTPSGTLHEKGTLSEVKRFKPMTGNEPYIVVINPKIVDIDTDNIEHIMAACPFLF